MSLSDRIRSNAAAIAIWAVATCYGCYPPTKLTEPQPKPKPKIEAVELLYAPIVRNNFQFLYDNITAKPDGVEFMVCLDGKMDTTGKPVLLRTILPGIEYAARDSVSGFCPRSPNYMGRAHSHPPGSQCAMSSVDTTSFINDTLASMHAVICDNRQMVSYVKRR